MTLTVVVLNTLRMGYRNHGARIVLMLGLLLLGAAWLGGSFSPRQPQTVALDIGISVLRILMTLLALYWVQELVAREIDRKTIIWALSYPQSRTSFLIGRFIGILLLLTASLVFLAGIIQIPSILIFGNYQQTTPPAGGGAYWLTIALFSCDLLAVSSFTLLLSSLATTPMLPFFLGLAFAICARSIGPTLSYLTSADGRLDSQARSISTIIENFSWLLPDLSRLDIRHISLYQASADNTAIAAAIIQALTFSLISITLACIAFSRRQFS